MERMLNEDTAGCELRKIRFAHDLRHFTSVSTDRLILCTGQKQMKGENSSMTESKHSSKLSARRGRLTDQRQRVIPFEFQLSAGC